MASRRPPRDSSAGKVQTTSAPVAAAASANASAAAKNAPRKKTRNRVQTTARTSVSPEERHAMIAEGAYLRAERRGFIGGHEVADWVAAEREVDKLLSADVTNSAQ